MIDVEFDLQELQRLEDLIIQITPEQAESFAIRTGDFNPFHRMPAKRETGQDLPQYVPGTQLIANRLEAIRKEQQALYRDIPILTHIDARLSKFVEVNKTVICDTPISLIKHGKGKAETHGPLIEKIDEKIKEEKCFILKTKFRNSYKARNPIKGKPFIRIEWGVSEEELRDSEFPIWIIPPALLNWQNNLVGDYEGANLRMSNGIYTPTKPGNLIVEIFPPTTRPVKERKSKQNGEKNSYGYRFPTSVKQEQQIITSGSIIATTPHYFGKEAFQPIKKNSFIKF